MEGRHRSLVGLLAGLAVAALAPACTRRAVLVVEVMGDSAGLLIEELQVDYQSVRLDRSVSLIYMSPEGAGDYIDLPNSFSTTFTGDIEDGDQLLVSVRAVGGAAVLLSGATTATLDIGKVTYATVDLVAVAACGDGESGTGEECDDGASNSDVLPDACRTTCVLPSCGDAVRDTGEECDASDLGGQDCSSVDSQFNGGSLLCTSTCGFDTSACLEDCGNGLEHRTV